MKFFLKLTRVPDGATVYVNPAAVGSLERNPEAGAVPVHTVVKMVGGQINRVLEKPLDVLVMMGVKVCLPPAPSPADAPAPAASPR